jgi:hypothetical protein
MLNGSNLLVKPTCEIEFGKRLVNSLILYLTVEVVYVFAISLWLTLYNPGPVYW